MTGNKVENRLLSSGVIFHRRLPADIIDLGEAGASVCSVTQIIALVAMRYPQTKV